jgi:hypothetical protein
MHSLYLELLKRDLHAVQLHTLTITLDHFSSAAPRAALPWVAIARWQLSIADAAAGAPPELPQLLGRVQELLLRDVRFVRIRETFIFLLCALVDRQVPAAVGAMAQGCVASILGSAHHFTHGPLRDEWTIGFLHAGSQFMKRQWSWAWGPPRAVLASALKYLSSLHDHFIILAQVCGLIMLFIAPLISRSESILSAGIP